MESTHIDNIISCIKNNFNVIKSSEITIEANPEDILNNTSKFAGFRKSGINRISVGVQSFIDKELSFLTRAHNSTEAYQSLEISKSIFDNVSADLIYAFNEQEMSDVEHNLNKILNLELNHISAYTLILEKGTLLYKQFEQNKLLNIFDKDNPQFYEFVNTTLINNGYIHYEVSNYAKPGFQSKHNIKYWDFDYYLGLGPSAHSFIGNERFSNPKSLKKYIDKLSLKTLPVENIESLTPKGLKNDYFVSVLRCNGVKFEQYKKLFGSEFLEDYRDVVDRLLVLSLAGLDNSVFKLNEIGYALADEITLSFLK